MSTPQILRIDGRLYVDTAAGRVELVPSHADRTKPRWWRVVDADGRTLSPWVGAVRIAAAWAASIRS